MGHDPSLEDHAGLMSWSERGNSMGIETKQPSWQEMVGILKEAALCLECDAPECHEFTPEGVDVCAELPFWDGRPVTKSMLLAWQETVSAQKKP